VHRDLSEQQCDEGKREDDQCNSVQETKLFADSFPSAQIFIFVQDFAP
jgi:hypothetical protein